MIKPPPLSRLPAYPVTGGVGLIAAAVTVLTASGRWDLARFTVDPTAFTTEPWRLVVSALPHAFDLRGLDVFHLPFNLYCLWLFGTRLEDVFGHVKTLALVVLLAAGSAMAEYALFRGGIGLSGVTYGMFGALWFLAPRDARFEDAVDARTTQIMVAWFFLCIACTVTGVWAIANVAHGVGALLGVLVGAAVAARRMARRLLASGSVQVVLMLSFVGATRLRPRVNLAHDVQGSAALGYQAIQDARYEDAIRHYRVAIATDPKDAVPWYNLGIAYESAGQMDEGLDAFHHAYELDATDTRHRGAYVALARSLAVGALNGGEAEKAVTLLRAVLAVEPDDALTWRLLGQAYVALLQAEDAADAYEHEARLRTRDAAP